MMAARGATFCAALCAAAGSSPAAAAAPLFPPQEFAVPSVELKNAAVPGTRYPLIGLGIRGSGYKLGQTQECFRYPVCCTKDYCPAINATRDWLRMGGVRVDTGYPFGDSHAAHSNPPNNQTCGGYPHAAPPQPPGYDNQTVGHNCDPHGTRQGIEQSGVERGAMFITIKYGFAGPMDVPGRLCPECDDKQGTNMLYWLGLDYADLALMHEGDLGNAGHDPAALCAYPTSAACRIAVFTGCLKWMAIGGTRACGVANWELEWLQELKDANVTLPAVVQMKFHPHQSLASPRIKAVMDFCDAHDIVFNGYSPLGRADWTRFDTPMAPTLFDESLVKDVATANQRSAAQVLLRWNIQQGIPTQARSMDPAHMKENMDVFDWALGEEDMATLGNMTQCTTVRGNPFMPGDHEYNSHGNMIGPTPNC